MPLQLDRLLHYAPAVPRRVPTRLFKDWTFKFPDGRSEVVPAGVHLTAAQRAIVAATPETSILRDEDELTRDRSRVRITFEVDPAKAAGKKLNPIPELAGFLSRLQRETEATVLRADLIGSFGWGSAGRGQEDVDLALVLDGDLDRDKVAELKRRHWSEEKQWPLALFLFSRQEYEESQTMRARLLAEHQADPYGEAGYKYLADLAGSPHAKLYSWYHDCVELVGPERDILAEYSRQIELLVNRGRAGDFTATAELLRLDPENEVGRELVKAQLFAHPAELLGPAVKLNLREMAPELERLTGEQNTPAAKFETALVILLSLQPDLLFDQDRVLANYYLDGLDRANDEQLYARLLSFDRVRKLKDKYFREYRYHYPVELALIRAGADRTGHPALAEMSQQLYFARYDEKER
jgi:hypothetical protein